MADIKITAWTQRSDREVKATVYVFSDEVSPPVPLDDNTGNIGHFEFTLSGDAVIEAFALPLSERNARMLELVRADPKIEGIVVSEHAQRLLQDAYTPPFVASV